MKCWICGEEAETGEHRAKSSDLAMVFKYVSYFLKMFGCMLTEHDVPIPTDLFAKSILNNAVHPNVYIGFGTREKLTDENIIFITPIKLVR